MSISKRYTPIRCLVASGVGVKGTAFCGSAGAGEVLGARTAGDGAHGVKLSALGSGNAKEELSGWMGGSLKVGASGWMEENSNR
eukprot:CAMPEP_0118975488 /NCGR_PEP_ID=MMETSP1173-20130426/15925_1 /TAXON_ID=1034831 /ORGANISM="Rhizochromulina marina cf, Strain CCMP1243" /LENGTH=83 /DNA_ID=CAMNT_0006925371 /DNA_START=375 /DNA_END=622 /DNA_ORIENTATION=+